MILRKLVNLSGVALPFGQVALVSNTEVSGWVENAATPLPVELVLSVNGSVISELRLKKPLFANAGHVPFKFFMPPSITLNSGDRVAVTLRYSGRHLAGSPWVVRATPLTGIPFGFLHIPKTAGTSLRIALEGGLGEACIFPAASYLSRRGGRYPSVPEMRDALWGLPDDISLIQGHMSLAQLESLAPEAKILTVLRDPVERTISLLKHLKAKRKGMSSFESLAQSPEGKPWNGVSNQQVKLLGGGAGGAGDPRQKPGEVMLARAVEALGRISVVGLTERYPETLMLCSKLMGVELGAEKKLNTSSIPQETLDAALLKKLHNWNALDRELYEEAKRHFARRLAEANLDSKVPRSEP